MAFIEVNNLIRKFGYKTVLRGLTFSVEEGEFVAILGPNGAGKTTFLRILASLSRPGLGSIRVAGYKIPEHATKIRHLLGVLSHQPLLYSDLSAEENLRFYGKMYNISELSARIHEVLDLVGLQSRRNDLVRTFSRGMQQRLAIGRAILHEPEILLLDEPHTGLDQEACDMLDRLLREVASRGRTVLMTSHDLTRIGDLASRFDILSNGKIIASTSRAQTSPDQLLAFYRQSLANFATTPL